MTDQLLDFMRVVQRGDRAAVCDALAANPALVNERHADCFGATPLMHAVNRDDRAMVDLLLDHGAAVDRRSDWVNGSFGVLDSATDAMAAHLLKRGATLTPHAAARLGMIDDLRRMLDDDPSLVHARGGDGQLPLHFSRTIDIAALLLDRGAIINARDIDHDATAAQYLVTAKPTIAAYLVSRGAAVDPVLCAGIDDVERLKSLIAHEPDSANMRITRQRFPAPPPAAGHIYLFTIGERCTLLHAAINGNATEAVGWLLANGADPDARGGYDDQTPLHAAAWRDAIESAALLLKAGADISAKSGPLHQNDPLGWAIVAGSERMVNLLLDAGATVQPYHRTDAADAAHGTFRALNNHRPLENWIRIAARLGNG